MEEPQRRKLIGPLEILMLIIGLGILFYVGFWKGGGKFMERTESVTILDKPKGPEKKARKNENKEAEESVELLLQELAKQLSGEDSESSSSKKAKTKKLSNDEKKYYEDVKEKATISEKIQTAKDWYQILNASQKTYSKVKKIVGEVSHQPEERINADNLSEQFDNLSAQADFYKKMSDSFNIDLVDIEAFGRKGSKALSDWAEFVEQQSKKE